jgi:pyruvate/2-oxoglutarate dehydrogenase complex dihydrolipoamide dehydrogenase (E3) component
VRRVRADRAARPRALRELGVDVFLGEGRFLDPGTIAVGEARLKFRRAVIATGARAALPDLPGLREAEPLRNETLFWLETLPARVAIIGAGPIGCEMAQRSPARQRVSVLVAAGLPATTDAAVVSRRSRTARSSHGARVERAAPRACARLRRGAGRSRMTRLVGRPCTQHRIGVRDGRRRIQRGVTSTIGCARQPAHLPRAKSACCKFTHAADAAAKLVVRNAFFFGRGRVSSLRVPWCTYTDPEVAHVGMYARDAEAAGIAIDTYTTPLAANDRSRAEGEEHGFVKIHVKKGTDKIVGATVVARHAGELIATLALGMSAGYGLGRFVDLILPYPTQAEAIKATSGAYTRTRLTPAVARVLKALIRLAR